MDGTRKKAAKGAARRAPGAAARLSRADWIAAGLKLLAERGIDAVAVEPLCERLGVTKGSFYWHFADRAALHEAMLAFWRERGTTEIVAQTEQQAGGARAQLAWLFKRIATNPGGRLETALRSWSIQDPRAAGAVRLVDDERIAYVAKLLRELGIPAPAALVRTRIVYLALIGGFLSASYGQQLTNARLWQELESIACA